MVPTKAPARSRRTNSYSWSSDSSALRPVTYQWPDHLDTTTTTTSGRISGDHTSDGATEERQHRIQSRVSRLRVEKMGPNSYDTDKERQHRSESRVSRPRVEKLMSQSFYDSDSCLTPRSRRTLRRTLSTDTEPWPSVKTPAKPPTLDTIYSPTHEILHPMQSLRLQKSLSIAGETKPLTVKLPARRAMTVDFDSPKSPGPAFKFETLKEDDNDDERATVVFKAEENHVPPEASIPESTTSSNVVVIIVDAEKVPKFAALDWAINVAVQPGDEIVVLGVLKHVSTPYGYKVVANTDPLVGVNQDVLQSAVKKTTALFEQKLTESGRRAECQEKKVKLTVRIAPGARARMVVVRELASLKATYAVFDRRILKARRYYGKHLSCHAVRLRSNGRSIKTVFSVKMSPTSSSSPTTPSSGSPTTSDTTSPTAHFWRRFTHFRSSRNGRGPSATSPEVSSASTASSSPPAATPTDSLNLDSFMSEMQDFSISLDRRSTKSALQSCVAADAYSYKQGMDAHRVKHRPMSVTIPPICAT